MLEICTTILKNNLICIFKVYHIISLQSSLERTFLISDDGIVAPLEFNWVPNRSFRKHCTRGCTLGIIQGIHTK